MNEMFRGFRVQCSDDSCGGTDIQMELDTIQGRAVLTLTCMDCGFRETVSEENLLLK